MFSISASGNPKSGWNALPTLIVQTDLITTYVGIGSNLGDRAGNLLLAVRGLMEASFVVSKLSGVYETEPVDIADSDNFLNMVAEIKVGSVSPSQMLARMLRIEYLLGRKYKSQKKPRTIDLDLLFYGQENFDTEFLTIPHPRIHVRNFVLVPMNEIAPGFIHPTLHKDIRTLLSDCTDNSHVVRWNANFTVSSGLSSGQNDGRQEIR
ncbi:MAG: 2-amino-4-hydroxy-6-hydroxymethyldihydropteridine diphosphokinase [Saprospiraceae bacterium]|nr:2-amino-4-hydroxy-6-hydroxymethyldihydropteridine diphosphokinase [Pyrinomonadaceae bacterium]